MSFILLLPVFLCALALGAHFLRQGAFELAAVSVAVPFVLLVRRPWAARLVQVGLLLAAIEWLRTLWVLARMRQAYGEPWTRMAIILGAVALINLASILVFRSRGLEKRYSLEYIHRDEGDAS